MKLGRFHRCEPSISVIITGVFIMSTIFVGLFLWGLVKRHKKSKAKAPGNGCPKIPGIREKDCNSLVLAPPPSTFLPPDSWNVCINDMIFDPETDYAQVLAEAQKFVAQAKFSSRTETTALHTNGGAPQENVGVHQSKSRQTKLENFTAQGKPTKASWKNPWLFWQRSKRGGDEGFCNTLSTQAQRSLKRSVSGPLQTSSHYTSSRKGNSGPIYSDGIPLGPANKSNRSGTRSGSATPDRSGSGHLESPYKQLKTPARHSYGPLYTV